MVRAFTYIRELGGEGLKQASERAVLNANYVRAKLKNTYTLPYTTDCLHEVVFTHKHTLDIAKGLIDRGVHPPTVYFPLIVSGALMIEPTETESKETLDAFVAAMKEIWDEAHVTPDLVKGAPHSQPVRRLDDVKAARDLDLTWKPLPPVATI